MISTVFMCKDRLPLSKMALLRYTEFMDELGLEHELILCYDGHDLSYVKELERVVDFSFKAINHRQIGQGSVLNKAHDACSGKHFMFLENDWWCINPLAIRDAIKLTNRFNEVNMIRLVKAGMWKEEHELSFRYETLRIFQITGYKRMMFHFNPQIRNIKYPSGRFPEYMSNHGFWAGPNLEWYMDTKFNQKYGSWCATINHFIHIGVFSSNWEWFHGEGSATRLLAQRKDVTLNDIYDISFCGAKNIKSLRFKGIYKDLFDQFLQEGLNRNF